MYVQMKAPLQTVPIIKNPFEKVAIDLIGPISPPSARGMKGYVEREPAV